MKHSRVLWRSLAIAMRHHLTTVPLTRAGRRVVSGLAVSRSVWAAHLSSCTCVATLGLATDLTSFATSCPVFLPSASRSSTVRFAVHTVPASRLCVCQTSRL